MAWHANMYTIGIDTCNDLSLFCTYVSPKQNIHT